MDQHSTIYEPLPPGCIRLLHLQPGKDLTAPLLGSLEIVSMDDGPAYEALSYAWGGAYESDDINEYFFGTDHVQKGHISVGALTVEITWNLRDALRRLRRRSQPRVLWIDAICIDQSNDEENSVQVAMMADIFSKASQVIVWLGEDKLGDGREFMKCCHEYARMSNSSWSLAWRKALFTMLNSSSSDNGYLKHSLGTSPVFCWRPSSRGTLLQHFDNRRYFKRRWCVQEMTFAKQVVLVCGSKTAPLTLIDKLKRGEEFGFDNMWLGMIDKPGVRNLLDLRLNSPSVLKLLKACSALDCSDDRDLIYALVSLLRRDIQCPVVNIDYTLAWPLVFLNFSRDLIAKDLALRWQVLLYSASQCDKYEGERVPDLPSWVVDWRLPLHWADYDE